MAKKSKARRNVWKRKRSKASVGGLEDRLSSLPDEILLAILSRLTMKVAARTSLVSHKLKQLWHCYPKLNFGGPRVNDLLSYKYYHIWRVHEKPALIRRVNGIIEHYIGSVVDEFKVSFDFNHDHHSDIDKWVAFAFEKNVKSLDLNLAPYYHSSMNPYALQMPPQIWNTSFDTFKPTLRSLCLSAVDVSDEMIQLFLSRFPLLEILRIAHVKSLRTVRSCSSLHLKHLGVSFCDSLEIIDLSVPQLLSFDYKGRPVELHLRDASLLSSVSMSSFQYDQHAFIAFAFDSILTYYSQQLECLELEVRLTKKNCLRIDPCPLFPKLKHLSLYVDAGSYSSSTLAGWTSLIKASPLLQKLTLKVEVSRTKSRRAREKFDSHPIKCLKTLEIVGFAGSSFDLEFAMHVVENAILLEEVIIDPRLPYNLCEKQKLGEMGQKGVKELQEKLPETAKITLI